MSSIMKELWPFFKEMFLKNKEMKDPKGAVKLSGVLAVVFSLMYIFYFVFNDVLISTYTRNTMLSENIIRVEEDYRESTNNNRILERSLQESSLARLHLEERLLEQTILLERFKKVNLTMGNELEICINERDIYTSEENYESDALHKVLNGL